MLIYRTPPPPSPQRLPAGRQGERGKDEGPSGYKFGILANFSKAKIKYRRVVIR